MAAKKSKKKKPKKHHAKKAAKRSKGKKPKKHSKKKSRGRCAACGHAAVHGRAGCLHVGKGNTLCPCKG